jgi:uncharacterized membrane protein (DUF485 family)
VEQRHSDTRNAVDRDPDGREVVRADVTATAAVVSVYFTFMLLVAFAPAFLAKPIFSGHSISLGLGFGIFVILFLVVAAALYTRQRNRAMRNFRVESAR